MSRNVRSDPQIVIDEIKLWGRGQLGRRDKVIAELQVALLHWPTDRLGRALDRAVSSPDYPLDVSTAESLVFSGSDRAVYGKVADGIRRRWGPANGMRDICIFDVSSTRQPGQQRGVWLFPDQIMFANPLRRGAGETSKRTHAIEIEYFGGFGVPSIYQALEQGRGADYTWVFGVLGKMHTTDHLSRIRRVAIEHRIGLVLIGRVSSPAGWRTAVDAARRRSGLQERQDFFSNCRLTLPTCGRGVMAAGCGSCGVATSSRSRAASAPTVPELIAVS